jgi:hypothetical protein
MACTVPGREAGRGMKPILNNQKYYIYQSLESDIDMEKQQPKEYDDPLLNDSIKRLFVLEDKAMKIEDYMSIGSLRWKSNMEDALNQLTVMKDEITEVQQDFRVSVANFLETIEFFRNSATREDFDKVSKRIEDWNPEDYVSMEELHNMIKKRLLELKSSSL